jgi:hypothetical protein
MNRDQVGSLDLYWTWGMKSVAVKVSASGRMTLPSEVRKALGLKGRGPAWPPVRRLRSQDMRTMAQALEQVRALARPYAPKDGLASEALIAERREES